MSSSFPCVVVCWRCELVEANNGTYVNRARGNDQHIWTFFRWWAAGGLCVASENLIVELISPGTRTINFFGRKLLCKPCAVNLLCLRQTVSFYNSSGRSPLGEVKSDCKISFKSHLFFPFDILVAYACKTRTTFNGGSPGSCIDVKETNKDSPRW